MKKKLARWSLVLATVLFVFASCSLLDDDYDEDMLIGTWTSTDGWTYTFNEDHTGTRTQADRPQNFTWSLSGDELEIEVKGYEQGVKKIIAYTIYIVEELNETRMEVYDKNDSSDKYVFTKK